MVFLSFITSIFVAIQDPIIQKFAIRIAGGYISQKTGTDIQIGRLYISPNFTIHIDQFLVKDLRDNTLLGVEELRVRPIMEDIIHGNIHVGKVELNNAEANLITYEDSTRMNFMFLLDAFSSGEKEKSNETTVIAVDRILLRNLNFQLWDQNKDNPEKTENHLMDYSHLVVDSISLDLEDLVIGDSITGVIHHLAANEASGFRLIDMVTQVNVSPKGILLDDLHLRTDNSYLHLDLHMLFDSYSAISSFVDSVTFDNVIYPTDVMLSDLGPFTEVLYKMPDNIHFEGIMKGPVRKFTVDKLKLDLGQQTHFEGNIALQPLEFTDRVQFLNIKRMDYDINDLASFYIPTATETIPIPDALLALGQGTIKGQFNGSFNKFKTDLEVTSEIGDVSVTLNRFINEGHHNVFEGHVEGSRVDVGAITNASKVIGTLDLSADVIARQDRKGNMDLDIDGSIEDIDLMGNNINAIALNGNLHNKCFNGIIDIADDELDLDFKGRFDFSNPKALGGDFQADITHADLRKLNLIKNDDIAVLQASITANMTSINNFNEAQGTLHISDVAFTNSSGDFVMERFDASIVNDDLMQKRITANCDFLDFEMAGKMDFSTVGIAFKQFVDSYVTFPQWTDDLERFAKSGKSAEQDFIVDLNLKDPKPLTKLLMPSLSIAKNTTVNGIFTTKSQSLNMTLRSRYVKINNIKINNIECRNRSNPFFSMLRLNVDEVILRDSTETDTVKLSLDAVNLMATLQNDSIKTKIGWDDVSKIDHNKADIIGSFVPSLTGGRFSISQANILLNDFLWNIDPNNFVVIDDDKIQISNLELVSESQSLLVDGFAPMQAEDTLAVSLNQFDLATLGFLFQGLGFSIDGRVSGDATLNNLKNDPTVFADLDVKGFGFNGETYGDAEILSRWDNEQRAIEVNVGLVTDDRRAINLEGAYYTARDENLDFTLDLDGLNLSILSPFLNNVVRRLQGQCYGRATIQGSAKAPEILGEVSVEEGGCQVNFLNTYYTFEPTITLTNGLISLNNFSLIDTLGNAALVTGRITHNHLKDMALDIKLYPRNFLAMATTANLSPSFHGTAIASGIVSATGPTNDLRLSVKAMTNKGTVMTIPLGGSSKVKQHEFITFVDHSQPAEDEEEETPATEKPKKSSNFSIDLDLSVNDDAQVKIALPNGLGSMEAKGIGNIKLGLPANNPMSLIGDYVINSGSLSLNIQDMLRRNFSLEPGSSISWTGDPVNGTIDATGVYQTKAALSSLGLADSTSMGGSNNVKVDCMVHLKNKLLNPDISFGLRLPNASEDLKQAVFYVVDTTNQAEMLLQTLYLMVFNTFNYSGGSDGYYNIITNQLNDIISQLTDDIDINVNYKPGGEMSSEEMTVALRKQLFDDRLTIETNFGVVRPTNAYSSNSTNIVGDFNIDYKITKDGSWSGQVFNRSNYNTTYYQYTYYKMAPYTQGIGLSYSKSFDNFKDLFRKRTNNLNLPNRPMIDRPQTSGQRPNRNRNLNQNQEQSQQNEQPKP